MIHVLMIVCGGIAGYKALETVRMLKKLACDVRVIMTPASTEFIAPKSFAVLSGHDVVVSESTSCTTAAISHIELAGWADVCCVVPATANTIAKYAYGIADNIATSALLATTAPVCVAPAMNTHMWQHPATQSNIDILRKRDVCIVGPDAGELACGISGAGKLADPEDIALYTYSLALRPARDLVGEDVLITAGPTREALDPVRCLTNYSTGKMGCALVRAARVRGARVHLIAGPLSCVYPTCDSCDHVICAQEMYEATTRYLSSMTIAVCTAAVADWQPANVEAQKIKKDKRAYYDLSLIKAPDILQYISSQHCGYVAGFAAETTDVIAYAQQKLARKGCNLMIANDVSHAESTFGSDTNKVSYVFADRVEHAPCADLTHVAHDIFTHIVADKTQNAAAAAARACAASPAASVVPVASASVAQPGTPLEKTSHDTIH